MPIGNSPDASPRWKIARAAASRACRSTCRRITGWRSRRRSVASRPQPFEPRAIGGIEPHGQHMALTLRLVGQHLAPRVEPCHRLALLITEMDRSEEHTSELPSLMRISYAVF